VHPALSDPDVTGVPHDVFISYATRDKSTADAICATLEARKIRCWIAPRDILPGMNYAVALMNAITASRILVLVFSSQADRSPHTLREVERAVNRSLTVIPFRIENIEPSPGMGYYIGSSHWLDAFPPPLEPHLARLADTVELLLNRQPGVGSAEVRQAPPVIQKTAIPEGYPDIETSVARGLLSYAGFWRRGAAYVIDLCIIFFVWTGAGVMMNITGSVIYGEELWNELVSSSSSNFLNNLWWETLVVIYGVYFIFMEIQYRFLPGASVGKYILGLRVIDSRFRGITLKKAVIRGILKTTPLVITSVIIPFTRRHQALHDLISDTFVIREKE